MCKRVELPTGRGAPTRSSSERLPPRSRISPGPAASAVLEVWKIEIGDYDAIPRLPPVEGFRCPVQHEGRCSLREPRHDPVQSANQPKSATAACRSGISMGKFDGFVFGQPDCVAEDLVDISAFNIRVMPKNRFTC